MIKKGMQPISQVIVATLLLLGLSSCSKPQSAKKSPGSWVSYHCMVEGVDYKGTGWATDEQTARASALEKCQKSALGSGSCQITECHIDR